MIQRVQSLFLLGVTICMILTLLFPIWEKPDLDDQTRFVVYGLFGEKINSSGTIEQTLFPYVLIGGFAILAAVIAVIEIFIYKNRLTQIKLGTLNSLVMSGVLGIIIYLTFQQEKIFAPGTKGDYGLGLFFPCVALLLNVLANRFIRRDENLVRSIDRIR